MTLIVADTNGLIALFRFRINIDLELQRLFGHWHVYVPPQVMSELERLSEGDRWAALALQYAQRKGMDMEELLASVGEEAADAFTGSEADADSAILRFVKAAASSMRGTDWYVLTNDRSLRDQILNAGGHCLILRSRSHLETL